MVEVTLNQLEQTINLEECIASSQILGNEGAPELKGIPEVANRILGVTEINLSNEPIGCLRKKNEVSSTNIFFNKVPNRPLFAVQSETYDRIGLSTAGLNHLSYGTIIVKSIKIYDQRDIN